MGQVFGFLQNLLTVVREIGFATLYTGQVLHLLRGQHVELLDVDAQLLENKCGNVLRLVHQGLEQMHGLYGLLTVLAGHVDCLLYGFLRLDCKFVDSHN